MGDVNAEDDLNKDALINAAKQLGKSSPLDDLDALIKTDKVIAPTQVKAELPKQTDDSPSRVKGVLPDELRKSNRLALYGKQKLVIHDESKHLKNSVLGLTKALSVSRAMPLEKPITSDNFDTKPVSEYVGDVTNDISSDVRNNQLLKHGSDKLKVSVSELKSIFANQGQAEKNADEGNKPNQ
jgi:hypothetical protein